MLINPCVCDQLQLIFYYCKYEALVTCILFSMILHISMLKNFFTRVYEQNLYNQMNLIVCERFLHNIQKYSEHSIFL